MSPDPAIFKAYDIRGVYPSQINEETIRAITGAIYKFFTDELKKDSVSVVLGQDMRLSSPALFEAAKKTLLAQGATVVDVGLISTPTFYFAVSHYGYDTGIQITASHNPKEYNGVKFVINNGGKLIKIGKQTGMDTVKQLATSQVSLPENKKGTVVRKEGAGADEVENALTLLGNPPIGDYTIVADPANAMGILYLEELFRQIPGRLIKMNFTLDGTFPAHQPDPLQAKTLVELQKRVVSEKADLGLAPDGDGDRLFFIDDKGGIVPPSIITALVARELLTKHPGEKILFDIRYIMTPKAVITENGGTYEITKVGHAYITESLNKSGGLFAGESSAHYFFRETGNAESQVPVIATVLSVMTREKKTLSQIAKELRRSFESGEINFSVANAKEIMDKLKKTYADGTLSEIDGVAIEYPSWRFNVRASNTEPLLRLNVESREKALMEEKRDELLQSIKKLGKAIDLTVAKNE